jgi:hypothetical protein
MGLWVLLFVVGYGPWVFDGVFHLVFGWVGHASTVLPKVTVVWSTVGMFCACLALLALIGHRFCRWLWQAKGRPEPWRLRWTVAGLTLIVVMFGAGMAFTAVAHQTGWLLRSPVPLLTSGMSSRNAAASLKTIASAQADFRANDRDDNKLNDFWRAHIAGLYTLKGSDGLPVKLIELSVAAADDRAVSDMTAYAAKGPKAGHWFRTLRYASEAKEPDTLTRFAACAYPENAVVGQFMYLVTEENTIFQKLFEGHPPEVCPEDPLKEGWSKLD